MATRMLTMTVSDSTARTTEMPPREPDEMIKKSADDEDEDENLWCHLGACKVVSWGRRVDHPKADHGSSH